MTTEKMTPRQFCRFAKLFPHLECAQIASMVKAECLPEPGAIAQAARELADNITPHDSTLAAHAFLHDLADQAEEAGKAVAA